MDWHSSYLTRSFEIYNYPLIRIEHNDKIKIRWIVPCIFTRMRLFLAVGCGLDLRFRQNIFKTNLRIVSRDSILAPCDSNGGGEDAF